MTRSEIMKIARSFVLLFKLTFVLTIFRAVSVRGEKHIGGVMLDLVREVGGFLLLLNLV